MRTMKINSGNIYILYDSSSVSDGIVLPKGQTIALFIFGMHRNAKYFQDPEKFIPERFENYEGIKQFSYVPFSAGPRNCIGNLVANILPDVLRKIVTF